MYFVIEPYIKLFYQSLPVGAVIKEAISLRESEFVAREDMLALKKVSLASTFWDRLHFNSKSFKW